jgi:membrane protease YdiL (CAAX protease family)
MMFYFATFLVLSLVLGLLLAAFKGIDAVVAQTGLYFMLILMTPLFATFPIFGDRIGFKEIIGDTTRIWSKIGWAVGGFMANLPLALMALWVGSSLFSGLPTPSHEAVEMLRASSGPMQTLLLFFTVAVAAPLIEEPMFRGVMLPAFQKSLRSPIWAIVLSSVIFAVIHPQGPMLWPALACVGATAAILTRQTGSLIPAIIMHGLHNATIFGLSVVLN